MAFTAIVGWNNAAPGVGVGPQPAVDAGRDLRHIAQRQKEARSANMAYPALNRREHTVLILRVKDHLNARMIPIARGQFVAAKSRHQHHPIAERQGAGKGAIENRSLAPRHHHFPFAHPAGEPGGQHNALFIHFLLIVILP